MKLNNKGFAITAVLYGILILFVFTVSTYLIALSVKKDRVNSITDEIADEYHYKETLPKYTVTYNVNGGSGGPTTQTKLEGIDLIITTIKPIRDGYTFDGWGLSEDDTTADYLPGSIYDMDEDVSLYAIWTTS